jgi:hypothetical protein
VRLLASHPWIGKETDYAHPKLTGVRLFLVRKPFATHLIFYRVCGDTLDMVHIVHGMRDSRDACSIRRGRNDPDRHARRRVAGFTRRRTRSGKAGPSPRS